MPTTRLARLFAPALGLAVSAAVAAAQAPAPAPQPTVLLRYRELTNRQSFAFVQAGQKHTKAVGDMTMEFPDGALPAAGLDPAVRTFCVEPLVPMYAGEVYPFQVDPLGKPASFGLPDTPEGVAAGEKRARFVRELYGKYYSEVAADPATNAPAFQVALWELTQETEVPDGPMPFSLATGTFRADYPNLEADSPAFVRTAQRYVQNLTGDDSAFASNQALANMELTRLTALRPVGGAAAGQSQLALRTAAPVAGDGADALALGGPGGGLGGIPTGVGGRSGLAGGGLGGPAVGSPGGFGGGGIGGFGAGTPVTTATGTTSPGTTTAPGNSGPAAPTTTFIPTIPTAPGIETGGSSGGPSTRPPEFPPPTNPPEGENTPPPPQPVPAPAGLVLVGVAAVALGLRRLRRTA
jgi:hypothetical protein